MMGYSQTNENRVASTLRIMTLALFALSTTACNFGIVDGDGEVTTESYEVGGFDKVEIGDGVTAFATIGAATDIVEFTADANLHSYFEVLVEDETLIVRRVRTVGVPAFPSPSEPIEVSFQTPHLTYIGASGGATVTSANINEDGLEIIASGGANVTVDSLDTTTLEVNGSGASEIVLAGVATSLNVTMSGGSGVSLFDLTVEDAEVDASGASTISLTASGDVTGTLSGGSTLTTDGDCDVNVESSGGSTANRR